MCEGNIVVDTSDIHMERGQFQLVSFDHDWYSCWEGDVEKSGWNWTSEDEGAPNAIKGEMLVPTLTGESGLEFLDYLQTKYGLFRETTFQKEVEGTPFFSNYRVKVKRNVSYSPCV